MSTEEQPKRRSAFDAYDAIVAVLGWLMIGAGTVMLAGLPAALIVNGGLLFGPVVINAVRSAHGRG